jgi:DNA-binding CsgD family transcriptional regulator
MNTRQLDELLLDLYACPSDRARWPTLLDRVCHATHARSAVIQLLVTDGERTWSRCTLRDSASEADRAEHERYMGDAVNPRLKVPVPFRSESRYAFRDRDFFAADDPALKDLEDRLAAVQLGPFMSVGASLPGQVRLALVLHRDLRNRRHFDADEESFALDLVPHLRQAIQLSARIDETRQRTTELESALDRLRCALVLCDSEARVLWANGAAERTFASGNRLCVSNARLMTASARETLALRRMIGQVSQADDNTSVSERYMALGQGGAKAPVQIMMHALSPNHPAASELGQARRVLLILSSPDEPPSLPADLIGRVFALSPAESRLAAALCSGLTINEYASANGVTIGTARFQMKQVLAKTQASRQADLVRRICSSVIAQAVPARSSLQVSQRAAAESSATPATLAACSGRDQRDPACHSRREDVDPNP